MGRLWYVPFKGAQDPRSAELNWTAVEEYLNSLELKEVGPVGGGEKVYSAGSPASSEGEDGDWRYTDAAIWVKQSGAWVNMFTRYTDAEAAAKIAADDLYLQTAGDTMLGPLILDADPALALGAATKQYVDAIAPAGTYLPLAGGTMTGKIVLDADPTLALHAATMQYVDAAEAAANTYSDSLGHHSRYLDSEAVTAMGLLANTNALNHDRYTDAEAVAAVGDPGAGVYLPLAGGTMTGTLTLAADPALALEAATMQYVDTAEVDAKAYADTLDHDHATPIATHAGDAAVHHAKYTDAEAVTAVGPHTAAQTYLHADLTDIGISDHHVKYADADAVAAMGLLADANALNHDRYTDTEAAAKVAADDLYVQTAGDAMTGALTLGGLLVDPFTDTTIARLQATDENLVIGTIATTAPPPLGTSDFQLRVADYALASADILRMSVASLGDMHLYDSTGLDVLMWDQVNGTWIVGASGSMAQLDLNNNFLHSPQDPSLGIHVGDRDYNDVRYLLAVDAFGGAHSDLTGIGVDDHHVKYTDSEAVTAMGLLADTNTLNHDRYADAEAAAKVAADDLYVQVAGDVMTGLLDVQSAVYYQTDGGGNGHFGYPGGNNYITHDIAAVTQFREYDSAGPSYKAWMQGGSVNGLEILNGDTSGVTFGPNTSWGGYLYVGSGPEKVTATQASVVVTNGNLHLDAADGSSIYMNYYATGTPTKAPVIIGDNLEVVGDIKASGVGARMYRDATDQAIAAITNTVVDWNATEYDTNSLVDLTNSRFVIPAGYGGVYVINAHVQWTGDPGTMRFAVLINGSTMAYLYRNDNGVKGSYGDASGSVVLNLADGDLVTFLVYYGVAGYIRYNRIYSSASIAKIA